MMCFFLCFSLIDVKETDRLRGNNDHDVLDESSSDDYGEEVFYLIFRYFRQRVYSWLVYLLQYMC